MESPGLIELHLNGMKDIRESRMHIKKNFFPITKLHLQLHYFKHSHLAINQATSITSYSLLYLPPEPLSPPTSAI